MKLCLNCGKFFEHPVCCALFDVINFCSGKCDGEYTEWRVKGEGGKKPDWSKMPARGSAGRE